jgi:hypothetical protein
VRFNSEPRSNSPLIGNLLTSFCRARRVWPRIIFKNESGRPVQRQLQIRSTLQFSDHQSILRKSPSRSILRREVV